MARYVTKPIEIEAVQVVIPAGAKLYVLPDGTSGTVNRGDDGSSSVLLTTRQIAHEGDYLIAVPDGESPTGTRYEVCVAKDFEQKYEPVDKGM